MELEIYKRVNGMHIDLALWTGLLIIIVSYVNMDYIFLATLAGSEIRYIIISYDIACQWSTNFPARVKALPEHVRFEVPTNGQLRYAIPKFHFRAHKSQGHDPFSLHLSPGVGCVDGEEIERGWARHNDVAYSTREMGPGSRHDTLEDHFGSANWQKYVGVGEFNFIYTTQCVNSSLIDVS